MARSILRLGIGLVLLAVVVAIILWRFGDAGALWRIVSKANPVWLVVGVALQVLSHLLTGTTWYLLLRRHDRDCRFWPVFPLALEKRFVQQAVPSAGLSGAALLVRALSRRNIPLPVASAVVLTTVLTSMLSFVLVIALAAFFLDARGETPPAVPFALAVFVSLSAVAIVIVAWFARSGVRRAPAVLEKRWPKLATFWRELSDAPPALVWSKLVLGGGTALRVVVFAVDAATLAVMLFAIGQHVPFDVVFAAFVMASVVATIGGVPGGLGAFEATVVALLHLAGTPVTDALVATLLLRLYTYWLPMIPGAWLVRREV